ncbi:MAG: YSIRK-type signal peptide-containing protein [Lactobacillus sp.]|jgi:LPXTG-motif cell wall-anchored protein|nr:YSIRK-type signal peptide-containing protein [Lactobacillus sp.]MCH3905523.1 YSIRK-type signal peptide-containing protein [Lactobacillus sp.]MCH3990909.1 YSIRK-type signal peptide-containing protein [Lactobacillus sp.]MCH4068375.1 YSIRK-type signal peptide-containing protein [Lactobacillus sp.]MCI1304388.1 YSIRK-type signal peptide-containing protein [Lactobacillus sp.]
MFIRDMNRNNAEMRQHFSIRKLTVGACSVMIGLSFYLGTNTNVAKAEVQQAAGTTQDVKNKLAATKSVDGEVTSKGLDDADSNAGVASEGSQHEPNTDNLETPRSKDTSVSDDEILNSKAVEDKDVTTKPTEDGKGTVVTNEKQGLTLSVSQKEYNPISVEKDAGQNQYIYPHDQLITLTVGGKSGEQTVADGTDITITLPTGFYKLKDVGSLAEGSGKTSFKTNDEKGVITITNHFEGDYNQTFEQRIILEPLILWDKRDDSGKLKSFNDEVRYNSEKKIDVSISDGRKISNTFTQKITPSIAPILSREVPEVNKDRGPMLVVDQDYTWSVAVNEASGMYRAGKYAVNETIETNTFNSSINDKATITIPVPDSFFLNVERTNAENADRNCPVTVSQAGKGAPVVFHIGRGKDATKADQQEHAYFFVGKFEMEAPDEDTDVTFGGAAVHQKLLHKLGELDATTDSWTEKIASKDHTVGPRDEDIYRHVYGYQSENELPMYHDKEVILNHVTFKNNSNQDLENAKITITMPDGLNATHFSIPQLDGVDMLNDITYTVILADGTKLSTPVKFQKDKDNRISNMFTSAKYSSAITTIEINMPVMRMGAKTTDVTHDQHYINQGGLEIYGTVANNYQNGNKVNIGDSVETYLTITGDNMTSEKNGEAVAAKNTQVLVGIPDEIKYAKLKVNQDNYGPGQNDSRNSLTAELEFEPTDNTIIYFVVPENAEYSPAADQTGITTFKAGNHQIVKYTRTAIKYSDKDGWTAKMNLKNADPSVTSIKPIDVYLVTGLDHTVVADHFVPDRIFSKVGQDDLALVENNADAFLISDTSTLDPNRTDPFAIAGPKQTWKIVPVLSQGIGQAAQGNKNNIPVLQGESDANGDNNMTFYNEVINGSASQLSDVVSVINLPQKSETSFKFEITGPDSIKVIDQDGKEIKAEVLYSTDSADVTQKINLSGYKTSAGVAGNWSSVKSIAVKLGTMKASARYNIEIKGQDKDLKDDNDKIGYLASRTESADMKTPFYIVAEDKSSASIKIVNGEEQSKEEKYSWTIKYQDESGKTLHTDKVVRTDYANGAEYDVAKLGPNIFLLEIKKDGKTYELLKDDIVNPSGTFNKADVTTILKYKLKDEPEGPGDSTDQGKPTNPVDPGKPTDPEDPTTPDQPTPDTPHEEIDQQVPEEEKTEPIQRHAGKRAQFKEIAEQKQEKATLPQTGTKKNNLWLAGLSLATLGLLVGLVSDRKRDN